MANQVDIIELSKRVIDENLEALRAPANYDTEGGFDDLILKELIAEGLMGDALKTAYEERKTQIRSAVKAMIVDADAAAKGEGEFYTMADVFGEE